MKKLFILVILAGFSHMSNGQEKEMVPQGSNDSTVANKIEALEQKLNEQQEVVESLKKENSSIKKQLKQLKSTGIFRSNNNKVTITRRGSKQVITE